MTTADKHEAIYQYAVLRLRRAWESFGGKCRAVLAGQAVNSWWVESGLKFAAAKYGDAKWIDTLAYAGYAALPENWPAPRTVDDVFAGLNANLKDHPSWKTAYRTLADRFGVRDVALYEAGQHLPGNNPLFVQAQDDPRMEQVYRGIAAAAGDVLINWFCSPQRNDGSGSWGWAESVDADSVKRRTIMSLAGASNPTPPPVLPPPVDTLPGNGGGGTVPAPAPGSGIASVTFSTQFGDITIKPPSWMKVTATYR